MFCLHTQSTDTMTNTTKQTAVEWLAEMTSNAGCVPAHVLERAKEIDKQDKITFAFDFFIWWHYNQTKDGYAYDAIKKYYNETYGTNK